MIDLYEHMETDLHKHIEFEEAFFCSLIHRTITGKKVSAISREYKNIIDWTVNALGLRTIFQYKRQYQVLRDFFALRCPNCNDDRVDSFSKSPEELEKEVLLEIDYQKGIQKCPKCSYTVERLPYDTLVLCVGMRSGKTVTAAIIASYIFYLSLIIPDIEKRFNLIPDQKLRASMVSTASKQTEKTVWADFVSLLKNSLDPDVRAVIDNLASKEDMSIDINTKEWNVNNIDFMALHSNSSSLAGGTGCLVILEEFSRFLQTESARSEGEVLTVLERSLKTTRSLAKNLVDDLFTLFIVISSPLYVVNDPTLVLIYGKNYEEEKLKYGVHDKNEKVLGYHYPTWLFNPFLKRENFNKEYLLDFFRAERDYGAMPRGGEDAFFEYKEPIWQSIIKGNGIVFSPFLKDLGSIKFWTAKCVSIGDMWGKEYCIHVDLGENNDLLTMAFSRTQDGIVYTDGLLVLKPEQGYSMLIDTPLQLITELRKKMIIKYVTFDRWQSSSSIQNLQALGIKAAKKSIGESELVEFKKLVYDNRWRIIDSDDESIKEFIKEVNLVKRIKGKISHVDVLMSIAGSVCVAYYGLENKLLKKQARNFTQSGDIITQFQEFRPQSVRIGRW